MDPYICCLLGICCPPATAEQTEKLVALLMKRPKYANDRNKAEARVKKDLAWAEDFRAEWND